MKKIFHKSPFLILFFLIFLTHKSYAQSNRQLFWEPEVELEISTESPWFFSIGAANRSQQFEVVDGERIGDRNQEHFELNSFIGYDLTEMFSASVGFRYRFAEIFDEEVYDEYRLIEQLNYANPTAWMRLKHRFRFEQRFRNVINIYRLRYQIGISEPLGADFKAALSTETLYSMAPGISPELDQRFSFEISNSSFNNVELSVGFEYQYENYTRVAENEMFIITGVEIEI